MNEVRIGIIGIGNMGTAHAKSLNEGKVEGMRLTAVCDIDTSRLDWCKENLAEDVAAFTDYKELIASGLVDAILVAVPHYFHPEVAIAGFEGGLNVLTEKPAGVYAKQVREMNEAAKKSGKIFGIMFNQRTNPYFAKMREVVQSGELGELKRSVWIITSWYRTQRYYDSGSWRATWSGEGGGVLLNQCPHNLDLWQWIFGMPSKIRATCNYGKWHNIEVEDDVTICAEYENGASGVFITSTGDCPGTNRFEITGDKGKMVCENGKLTWWKLSEPERKVCFESDNGFYHDNNLVVEDVVTDKEETAHIGILQNFTNAILKGEELLAPGFDGINGVNIANAAHLSDWTNEWVNLPVDEDKFLNLLNERRATSKAKEHVESIVSDLSGTYNDRWKVR